MPQRLTELALEVATERRSLAAVVAAVGGVAARVQADPSDVVLRESLALKLHNFYTGLERIFRRVTTELNGGPPVSSEWHRRLLERMTHDIPEVRPAVLDESTAAALDEYLSFRHVVRNVYGFELDAVRLLGLASRLPLAWKAVEGDLSRFEGFLERMS